MNKTIENIEKVKIYIEKHGKSKISDIAIKYNEILKILILYIFLHIINIYSIV